MATVGLLGAVATACVGVLTSRRAEDRVDARLAAHAVLESRAADEQPEGGSIAPDAPVEGYSDLVVVSAKTKRLEPVEAGERHDGPVFRRQWRIRTDEATGARLVEVSCELTAGEAPATGATATRVVMSRAGF